MLMPAMAMAGGPRFVTGPPFFTGRAGVAIGWKQPTLLYYTDPGSLSAAVNHPAADALVAAAAGVWNLPVASITVAQGGALAEHVSGQNVYLDTTGLVFPADVMSANAASVPVAVIYDTDGSVTDLLLGSGASDPSGCRQNSVTENVDSFDPAGYILHAILVVNGRCTGSAPEQQTELQYHLMRAFGRLLGLAWSQTNDNVFTGTPTPTYDQAMNWPVMHPIDIVCGPYSYQCMPSPFQLRPDDIAAMVSVYPIAQNAPLAAGKQPSLSDAHQVNGHIYFPTGEGMAGVNVLVRRQPAAASWFEGWYEASAVTGALFQSGGSSPFVSPSSDPRSSFGTTDASQMGAYLIAYVPIYDGVPWQNVSVSTEPLNALYVGNYSVGPYTLGAVSPSGAAPPAQTSLVNGPNGAASIDFTVADAAAMCGNGADGTSAVPMTAPATGWWNGLLCGYGHASYVAMPVTPGRSFTVEVTALDEQGLATTAKAMPVIALFAPTDEPGALPSLGVTPSAFQARGVGTTTISAQTGQLTGVRIGIADERGDGRPDFTYQARFFYADSVLPAELAPAGGQITIAGMGFRAGNAVTINGVAATVVSWSPSAIVAIAPSMLLANAVNGTAVDIVVSDLSTGAGSTMTAALTYTTANKPNTMRLVSAPSGTVYVGDLAPAPFSVQVLAPDGITPVAGESVVFAAAAGSVNFGACTAATCTVRTDANGMASTGVTPQAAGAVTLQAADGALKQSAAFTAEAQAGSILIWLAPTGNQPVGVAANAPIALKDRDNGGNGLPGRAITFTVIAGAAIFAGCSGPICTVTTDTTGQIVIQVTPTAVGPVTIQAADGDVKATASFTAVSNTDIMKVAAAPTPSVYLGANSGSFNVTLDQADGVSPDTNRTVVFSAPAGVTLSPCESNVCAVSSGWSGTTGVGILASQTGTFTIQASFGAVTQSASFTVMPHTLQMKILSAPSGILPVGVQSPTPFAVQVLADGTTPVSGETIELSGPIGYVLLSGCNNTGACYFFTDANGMVSTYVTPIAPGIVTLNAVVLQYNSTATFTAVGVGEAMTVVQQPGAGGVWVGDTVNLAVQIMAPGGLTPVAGDYLRYSILSGPFAFSDYPELTVQRQTDGNGMAYEVGVATAPGTVTVLVSDGTASQTITFVANARPDVMQLVSAPASGGTVGTAATVPFSVRVLLGDGVNPAVGRNVTVSVTNGSARLSGCGSASSCVLATDLSGTIATAVTPLSSGTITLLANDNGVQQTASFTVGAPPAADVLSLVSTPGSSAHVGAPTVLPFSARVTLADGTTPAVGVPIVFAIAPQSQGAVTFGACGAATCTVLTGTDGVASTTVTGATAGALTLVATASLPTGAQSVSTAFVVVANQVSLTALNPQTYVAEGATLALALNASAIENGNPAAGQAVHWTASTGFLTTVTGTVTDANGGTVAQAVLGPVAAKVTAKLTACAWTSVCAEFDGTGVAASSFAISLVSGGGQAVTGTAIPAPVVAIVLDSAGHPVAAAPVNIYQTVTALTMDCPDRGRCPAAPVLTSSATVVVSGIDGTVTVPPLTVAGTATQTQIAFSAGTQGFATAVVTVQP
jgi:hypothetical protein